MKDRELLERALKVLAAILRGDNVPREDVNDLYADIGEHLEGYDVANN